MLANAKAWTFGQSDTVNAAYDRAWDKSGLGGTWAETGSNVFANISRDSFISALGGSSASAYRAGGSSANLLVARGVQLYDYGSGAYDVVQGAHQVRQGNNWGWAQIAGGGLSVFNAGDISLKVDDFSSVGSLGRPARPGSGAYSGIGAYSDVGGHHIFGKAAYNTYPNFDPLMRRALSVSEARISANGGIHRGVNSMTSLQGRLFDDLAADVASGVRHNTFRQHTRIATNVLREGGFSSAEATQLALTANRQLRSMGVRPIRIPGN